MNYLKITITDMTNGQKIIDVLCTTAEEAPFVQQDCSLYLQLPNQEALITEVFSLGMSFNELMQEGIDYPFDFEIVTATQLPLEVAMKMN